MKKLYKNNNLQKLSAYSAMAGAFIALGSEANAQVIYTDIDDEVIEVGDFLEVDMDADGNTDFIFTAFETLTGGGGAWTIARVFGSQDTGGTLDFGDPSNRFIAYVGPFSFIYGSALDEGDAIDAGADFNSTANAVVIQSLYGGAPYGGFMDAGDKYLGLKFIADAGTLHFGWVRLDATSDPFEVTLKDYAYDATTETAIDAGSIGVSIEQTISSDQLSIYSYGKTISIAVNNLNAENATVNIYNMSGQVVFSNILNQNGMQVSLANLAEGTYTVKVIADDAAMAKQVLLID